MRYRPGYKAQISHKIVKEASARVRAEGLDRSTVSAVMHDAGLTHGGFYKHFKNKNDLLVRSLSEGFREIEESLLQAAEQSPPGEEWKGIVRHYLDPEHCEHPDHGCPLATLGPELARLNETMKPRIASELINYKHRVVRFMPGRRTGDKEQAFFAIFATMIGAIEIARLLPDRAMRKKVLRNAKEFLLRSF